MKVIIAGSRYFDDYETFKSYTDKLLSNRKGGEIEIVSGGAKGADALGERYAKERGYPIKRFPANWNTHGKKALCPAFSGLMLLKINSLTCIRLLTKTD